MNTANPRFDDLERAQALAWSPLTGALPAGATAEPVAPGTPWRFPFSAWIGKIGRRASRAVMHAARQPWRCCWC